MAFQIIGRCIILFSVIGVFLVAGVEFFVDGFEMGISYVGINLSGGNVTVTE